MNPPSTTVSRGYRRSFLGTLVTLRGCRRYWNSSHSHVWHFTQQRIRLTIENNLPFVWGSFKGTETVALQRSLLPPGYTQLRILRMKEFYVYVLFVVCIFFPIGNMCIQTSCGLFFYLFVNSLCASYLTPRLQGECLYLFQIGESYLIICVSAGDQGSV